MAKVIYGAETIKNWIEEKQQLEVMLASDLLDRFNSPAMIGPLRTMASAAINKMAAMPTDKVNAAISEEKNKANMQYLGNQMVLSARPGGRPTVLTISNQADLAAIWQRNPMPDAQYCSDIIRLFGTCIEKCGGKLAEEKEEYRDKGSAGHLPWADGKRRDDPKDSGRYRDKGGDVPFAPVPGYTDVGLLHPDVRAQKQAEFQKQFKGGKNIVDPRLIPTTTKEVKEPGQKPKIVVFPAAQKQIEDAMISKVQRFLIYQQGGQAVIAMKDASTVGRINRVFGTVPASDISGTTADTLFFFDQMKGTLPGGALDPVYFLLPAATIVAGGHHSLLEVALALSLWKNTTIDYHIGFYTSLLPAKATINRGEILKSLEAAERHKLNHHMLIFYKEANKIDGCFLFQYGEAEAFNRLFTKVTDVEVRFRKVPAWPKEGDIKKTWPARYFFGQAA